MSFEVSLLKKYPKSLDPSAPEIKREKESMCERGTTWSMRSDEGSKCNLVLRGRVEKGVGRMDEENP